MDRKEEYDREKAREKTQRKRERGIERLGEEESSLPLNVTGNSNGAAMKGLEQREWGRKMEIVGQRKDERAKIIKGREGRDRGGGGV